MEETRESQSQRIGHSLQVAYNFFGSDMYTQRLKTSVDRQNLKQHDQIFCTVFICYCYIHNNEKKYSGCRLVAIIWGREHYETLVDEYL